MIKIAHLVHPVVVPATSDLVVAQPITFRTMQVARDFVANRTETRVEVTLLSARYHDESPEMPADFQPVPDLDRSVGDVHEFAERRKLAILRDLLGRLYDAAPDADYLIYTNVDIAVQPFFYQAIGRLIAAGHDGLVINRRSISDQRTAVEDIPLMYAELGDRHTGWDCFVFPRDLYPRFQLGDICVGTRYIGLAMVANLVGWCRCFRLVDDAHLTFHVGKVVEWTQTRFLDYQQHNEREFGRIVETLLREPDGCVNRDKLEEYLRHVASTMRSTPLLHRLFGVRPPPRGGGIARRLVRGLSRVLRGEANRD